MGNITELVTNPVLRRNTIAALMMAVAGQGVLWGIGFWSVDLLLGVLNRYEVALGDVNRIKSVMFFIQQFGAMIGIYLFAALSERTGRRPAFVFWFLFAWISIPLFYWTVPLMAGKSLGVFSAILGPISFSGNIPEGAQGAAQIAMPLAFFLGFATLGPFSGFTVYFPELYPTRLRATGCGICYNGGRFLAAIVPIVTAGLAAYVAREYSPLANGYPLAATIFSSLYLLGIIGALIGPETRGKPLPEEPVFEPTVGPVAKSPQTVPQ